MGRLSNPPEPLETLTEQDSQSPGRRRIFRAQPLRRAPAAPETIPQETPGRLSNPFPRPTQRRLDTTDIDKLAAGYRAGRSLSNLAKQFRIHHRTVAAHLDHCGVPHRMNARKLTNKDVDDAPVATEPATHSPQ